MKRKVKQESNDTNEVRGFVCSDCNEIHIGMEQFNIEGSKFLCKECVRKRLEIKKEFSQAHLGRGNYE